MRRRAPPKSAAAAARRLAQSVRLRAGVAAAHAHERVALRDDRRKTSLRRRRRRHSAGLRTPRKFMRNIPRGETANSPGEGGWEARKSSVPDGTLVPRAC